MSVITDNSEVSLETTGYCTFCGGHLFHPFVEWHATPDDPTAETYSIVTICKQCCRKYSKGLQADLIQINAIIELERLYPGFTLTRTTRAQRERERPEFVPANRAHHHAAILKTIKR
jgi:hypothetical protein